MLQLARKGTLIQDGNLQRGVCESKESFEESLEPDISFRSALLGIIQLQL